MNFSMEFVEKTVYFSLEMCYNIAIKKDALMCRISNNVQHYYSMKQG